MPRVLLIGWDAADWKVIRPLLEAGQMPNLQRLMLQGVHGNLATIYPPLSPMLWTSIATGKRPYKHGIHGFSEPLPDGSGVRPISLLSRKTKAMWNILNQNGHRSLVVGWWPSHPAEPLDGVMVSNHFQQPTGKPGAMRPLPSGTVHPAKLAQTLEELRVNPMELSGEFIRLFVPEYEKVDQSKDKRLHSLGKIVAETISIHAVATELLETEKWDFAGIYYSGIDHFGHGFMSYHPPRLPWVSEADFAIYQHVIANAYRYHDAMLGTLLGFADENTTVILMSDHGFHPDHLRPEYIPAEPAGPALEHRHFGILCMKGPALRVNEPLFGAGILDVCPTILTLFGLPPGKDMDGKVLLTAFKQPPPVEPIPSWDDVPGNAGTHPPEVQVDAAASAAAFKQLVELGYVAPPGANVQETVDECVRELKYNLARAFQDGNYFSEAAALADELWERWPREHRFGILLVDSLGLLRQLARRREVIEELGRRIDRYQVEAKAELEKHQATDGKPPGEDEKKRIQFEIRQLRELAAGRPLLIEWYRVTHALLENRKDEARKLVTQFAAVEESGMRWDTRLANVLAELGELEPARTLFEEALKSDPENPLFHGSLATLHFKARRFEDAIKSATESLSLMYFQPGLHALLGRALMESKRFAEAEQELQVAVAQNPRNLVAHESLAKLYRDHLNKPAEAFPHEGKAQALRHELAAQERGAVADEIRNPKAKGQKSWRTATAEVRIPKTTESTGEGTGIQNGKEMPAPFGPEVDLEQVITVVSGLPRSGTSMMMQILAAAGRETLSDSKRAPDEDNPLGYFEFEKATELARDVSWIHQARGKVVKIVAQLLPFLPLNEHYQLIFMERDLEEVIASQNAMLARQGRRGAELDPVKLTETYAKHLERVNAQIARRRDLRVLKVRYGQLLSEPRTGIENVASFVGAPFEKEKAAKAVQPGLRRQGK